MAISKDQREAKMPVGYEAAARHTGHRKPSSCPEPAKNAELRRREHLTPAEVERMIEAAKNNRHGHRDATMVWSPTGMAYVPPRFAALNGARSTSLWPRSMSGG